MELQLRISNLQQKLETVDDESIIAAIETILGLFQKANVASRETIGYSPEGEPITKADLLTKVTAASDRVKAGNYISQEEMEKELENW